MPATNTLQRGTGPVARVEGVTWGTNLSRTRQGDRQDKLLLKVQAALDPPQCLPGMEKQGKRETMCSCVAPFSLPGLGLFWYQGCRSLAIYFKELLLWRW